MHEDQQFVEDVVRALVDYPDDVKTVRIVDEMGVLITLTVNPLDMGRVVGREGKAAQALRTLLRAKGMRNQSRVNLKITDPRGPAPIVITSASSEMDEALNAIK